MTCITSKLFAATAAILITFLSMQQVTSVSAATPAAVQLLA